jgi:hypothetical protein
MSTFLVAALEEDLYEDKYNIRHRDLGPKVMCLDLGKHKGGVHSMRVSSKKYYKNLIQESGANGGNCPGPTKSLKSSIEHPEFFCVKKWSGKDVTIQAPGAMRKWLTNTVGADKEFAQLRSILSRYPSCEEGCSRLKYCTFAWFILRRV